jgi:hypothetical protein
MSEQETFQEESLEEASEQSLAESVSELEQLTQQALEMDGEAREELVEQIKSKCEEEGLSSEEAEALLEEIGLVQEARKVKETKKTKVEAKKKTTKEDDDEDEGGDDGDDDDSGDDDDDDEVEEAVEIQLPKTKAAAMVAFQEKLGKLKKADIMANYASIMKSLELKEGSEEQSDTAPIDVKDDIEALVAGEELSEEFKEKASTIFEAAVQAKVNQIVTEKQVELENANEKVIEDQVASHKQEMVEQVDNYLQYVADEWMKENQLAIEKGIRTEITEGFISGLKNLFEEHYITIPEDKVDVVDDLFGKIEDLEKDLNEQIQKGVDQSKELSKFKKDKIVQSLTSGLSDTQADKVKSLAEGVEDEDPETFEKKVEVIKENYFPANQGKSEIDEVENNAEGDEKTDIADPVMKNYMTALSKTIR